MEFALNFFKSNAGIDTPALLSSPFLLVTLGIYGHKRGYRIGAEEAHRLRHRVLLANAKGCYSRWSSETILDQDLVLLRQEAGADALLDRLRLQVGRLDIAPDELEGRNQRSALFKTMFLAFRDAGAKDWLSKLSIALDHSGQQHRLEFHHIFPKAVMRGSVNAPEVDDIATSPLSAPTPTNSSETRRQWCTFRLCKRRPELVLSLPSAFPFSSPS